MRWNSHYSACSITSQHIISNPYRQLFSGKRMNGISTCKNSGNFFYIRLTFTLTAVLSESDVFFNSFFLFRACYFFNQLMLWSKRYERNSEDGIGTGSEDFYLTPALS